MNWREAIRLAVYAHYCAWCRHIRVEPASFLVYEFHSGRWIE